MVDITDLPLTLTVPETASHLRVSRRTVFKLLETGQLKSVKVGRSRRIPRQSVAEYIDHLSGQ